MKAIDYFEEYRDKPIEEDIPKVVHDETANIESARQANKKARRKVNKISSINNRQSNTTKFIDVTKGWKRQFFEVKRMHVKPSNESILGTQFKNGIKQTKRNN